MHDIVLFIFRRDLRLFDNTALIEADKNAKNIIPIFILDPQQIENPNRSSNCIQFMIESLIDLHQQLKKYGRKLSILYGQPWRIIEKILKSSHIGAIYTNYDYSVYSRYRDEKIGKVCKNNQCEFLQYEDLMLHNIESIKTATGKHYEKFTPYYETAKKEPIQKSQKYQYKNLKHQTSIKLKTYKNLDKLFEQNDQLYIHGGRSEGLKILKSIKKFSKYNHQKNIPSVDTTLLSAHNKFGTLSIREVYEKIKTSLGSKNELIRQLYWRDFYYNQIYFNKNYFKMNVGSYAKLKWNNSSTYFNKWKTGQTGIPIVDAGMRQLNTTGWMHNRVRMLVAMTLTKLLLIDWRKGEKYFQQKLLDYDVTQNIMNWYWISGEVPFGNPYFRIMNPFVNTVNYDPQCEYIKKWIPELKNIPIKDILKWDNACQNCKDIKYPCPIVDIHKMMKKSISMYK